MLRIREEHRKLAIYLSGRLILEDTLWHCLFRLGEASKLNDILTHPAVAKYGLPLDKVQWLLHQRADRFWQEGDGRWGLVVWHILPKYSFLVKAQLILEASGLPLTKEDLAILMRRCHYPEHAGPQIVEGILGNRAQQATFVKSGESWLLLSWLSWRGREEGSLLDQMMEPDNQPVSLRFISPAEACTEMLWSVGVAVSTGHLVWALKRMGIDAEPSLLFRIPDILCVYQGHWVLREAAPELVSQVCKLGIEDWEHMEQQLDELKRKADLERLEQRVREEIHQLMPEAISILHSAPLSLEEMVKQLGLDEWVKRATDNEASEAKLFSIGQSELMGLMLDQEEVSKLPSGKLLMVSQEWIKEVTKYLGQKLCALSAEEILETVLQLTLENGDKPVAARAIQERLEQCYELEITADQWHLSRRLIKEKLTADAVKALAASLQSRSAPIPSIELAQNLFHLALPPEGIMEEILIGAIEDKLAHHPYLWRLGNGYWWVLPEYLVIDARLQRLQEQQAANPHIKVEELILTACGLQFNGLNADEKGRIIEAFSKKLAELVPRESLPTSKVSLVPGFTSPPALVPPKRVRITLTEQAIVAGRIPITPGLRQMISAYRLQGEIKLATYGAYQLTAWIDQRKRHLWGKDIAKWFQENKVQPGDVIYLGAPDHRGEALRLYTAFEIQEKADEREPIERKQRIYFREQLYQILSQNGKVMNVDELCEALEEKVGQSVRRTTIQGTLSRESKVFVSWGKAYWGLREWGDDWRARVDKEALLMRILEEDLIVEILRDCRHWMSMREIAQEMGRQFLVTTDFVLETSFLDPNDSRLVRRGDLWGLQEWTTHLITSWFSPVFAHSDFKLLVNNWLQQEWGLELEELMSDVRIRRNS